jgi:hypothetical protein
MLNSNLVLSRKWQCTKEMKSTDNKLKKALLLKNKKKLYIKTRLITNHMKVSLNILEKIMSPQ